MKNDSFLSIKVFIYQEKMTEKNMKERKVLRIQSLRNRDCLKPCFSHGIWLLSSEIHNPSASGSQTYIQTFEAYKKHMQLWLERTIHCLNQTLP